MKKLIAISMMVAMAWAVQAGETCNKNEKAACPSQAKSACNKNEKASCPSQAAAKKDAGCCPSANAKQAKRKTATDEKGATRLVSK